MAQQIVENIPAFFDPDGDGALQFIFMEPSEDYPEDMNVKDWKDFFSKKE